jgi:hypothetical protein
MTAATFGHFEIGAIEEAFAGSRKAATEPAPDQALKPYRPGSGTEGMAFDDAWCSHCARDAAWREDQNAECCDILSLTFALDIRDPDYPREWVYGRDGRPCCTAFTTEPDKALRCDRTLDLFPDAKAAP